MREQTSMHKHTSTSHKKNSDMNIYKFLCDWRCSEHDSWAVNMCLDFSLIVFNLFSLAGFLCTFYRTDCEPLKIMTPSRPYKNCSFLLHEVTECWNREEKKMAKYSKKDTQHYREKDEDEKKMGLNFIWCDVFPMWRIFCAGSLFAFDICSPQVSSGRSILDSITFSHHSLAVRLWSSCVFVSFYALWACYKKIQHKTNEEIACFFFAFKY